MKYIKWNRPLKVGMRVKYGSNNEFLNRVRNVNGDYATITHAGGCSSGWSIEKNSNGYWTSNGSGGVLLVETKGKELPVKYIVVYDTKTVDPVERFSSDKELNEWLEEARTDSQIIFESIEVFDVTRHRKVEVSFDFKTIK